MKNQLFKNIPLILCFASAFFGSLSRSGAQTSGETPELLQEFFVSETVFAQEKNEFQVTTKPGYWKKEGMKMITIPLQFEYGFTDRFQVELTLPYNFLYTEGHRVIHGRGNAEAGFLYSILKGNKPFAFSMGLEVELPTEKMSKTAELPEEAEEAEEPGVEWEPSLIIARQFGKMQVHANLAAEISKSGTEFNYNLATAVPFGNWLATLELNGKFADKRSVFITPGILWKGIDDFEFGAAVSKGGPGWGFILMATYEFSLGKK